MNPVIEADLFGQPVTPGDLPVSTGRKREINGYARRPGSGPAGETCGSCAKCVRVNGGSRNYHKCLVIQHRWTHGPGTDIKKRSPACEMWEPSGSAKK